MYSCLKVPELLSEICWYANDPDSSKLSDLVALAMTCKALRNPALDVLYYELHYLAHLLMCLPRDLWVLKDTESSSTSVRTRRTLSFRRPMVRNDWLVLKDYTPRVRYLRVNDISRLVYVDTEALSAIHSYSGANLFPNLRQLTFFNQNWTADSYPPLLRSVDHFPELFFGPRLTKLDLGYIESKSLHVLSAASRSSPLLEIVGLSIEDNVEETPSEDKLLEVLEDVGRLSKIQRLEIALYNHLSAPALRLLELLQPLSALTTLDFSAHNLMLSALPSSPTSTAPLPTLQTLNLASNSTLIPHIMHLLYRLPCLLHLNVTFEHLKEDGNVPLAVAALAGTLFASQSPILTIALQFPDYYSPGVLPFTAIRPLFQFRTLRYLALELLPHPPFDDAMLAELAGAFADLRHLTLSWKRYTEEDAGDTNFTFFGFISLLRQCPNLQELTVAINTAASANTHVDDSLIENICHAKLTKWNVLDSVLCRDDVHYVIRRLVCVAPRLRDIVFPNKEESALGDKTYHASRRNWKTVGEMLSCFQAGRDHCNKHSLSD